MDPGKQTGIALWFENELTAFDLPYFDAMDWFEEWIDGPDVIGWAVSESIHISAQTHKKGPQVLMSIEQIGIMRQKCRHAGVTFETQSPNEAKSFGTDAKLKAMGWWTVGSDHARDATRHLILKLCRHDTAFASNLALLLG